MASSPITSWQTKGGKLEAVTGFLFSEITMHSDSSQKMERYLLLGREALTNLESTSKGSYITLLTKTRIVKATVFPLAMNRCEN